MLVELGKHCYRNFYVLFYFVIFTSVLTRATHGSETFEYDVSLITKTKLIFN